MTEVEAAYIVNALAEGKHMTEGALATMTARYLSYPCPRCGVAELTVDGTITSCMKCGDERSMGPFDAYIETLERAVLAFFGADLVDCAVCGGEWSPFTNDVIPHASDCMVPSLIAKYPDA